MPNLAFIRTISTHDCWDYYEVRTDAMVFGDLEGYNYFRQQLLRASKSKTNVHLALLEKHRTSMRGVILPPVNSGSAEARLKFIERFMPGKPRPNMELVIFGNKAGYRFLAKQVAKLEKQHAGHPSGHIHLDDLSDPQVVPRSVSLNLRGPVQKWTRKSFGEYAALLLAKQGSFLPKDLARYDPGEKYEAVSAKKSVFLNLGDKFPAKRR